MVPAFDDCYPWQPGGCEWTIRYLWRWMSPFGCLDVTLLALMLLYAFAVVIYVYSRYCLARSAQGISSASTRKLGAVLNIKLVGLKSIAITAPYLGLVGTCEGILSALSGGAMERHVLLAMITTRMALALVPTAAAIPVAVLATSSYNFLRTRIDLLIGDVSDRRQQRSRHFQGSRRFSPTKRFSGIPALGLLAAPALAFTVASYLMFGSFHTSKGFYVDLAPTCWDHDAVDQLIVLHITSAGEPFLNQEKQEWSTLGDRLSEIYSMRKYHTLYLLADPGVSFRTVARALDTVESVSTVAGSPAGGMKTQKINIEVRLVTLRLFNAACIETGSGHRVLKERDKVLTP